MGNSASLALPPRMECPLVAEAYGAKISHLPTTVRESPALENGAVEVWSGGRESLKILDGDGGHQIEAQALCWTHGVGSRSLHSTRFSVLVTSVKLDYALNLG